MREHMSFLAGIVALLLYAGGGHPLRAQMHVPDRLSLNTGHQLVEARLLIERGRPREAIDLLRPLVDQRPDWIQPRWGAASYWLGRAHEAQGDCARAHQAWRAGVNALFAQGRVNVPLFQAYVTSVFRWGNASEQASAADAYLHLLGTAAPGAPPTVRRHVAHLLLLWPKADRTRLAPDPDALFDGSGTLTVDAGSLAVMWWNRQDPRPATPRNERLIEHMQRVAQAEQQFGDDSFLRVDARGRIYIRLGTPEQRRTLTSDRLAKSTSLQSHFIPHNEYWRYQGFGRHAHYLFIRRSGRYVQGGVIDLLPTALRHNMNDSRGLTAVALRDLYDPLVPRVSEYATLFDRVSHEAARAESVLRQSIMAPSPGGVNDQNRSSGRFPPSFFDEARRAEREVATQRAREVPPTRSAVAAKENTLPVALRTARFLRPNGTTRVEAYWSVRRHHLEMKPVYDRLRTSGYSEVQGHRLRLTARRYDTAYRPDAVLRSEHRVRRSSAPSPPPAARVLSVRLEEQRAVRHLAFQWDHLVTPRGADPQTLLRVQSGIQRVDSLTALPANASRLVLSDLVPLQAATFSGNTVRDTTGFQPRPYPFDVLDPDMPLGVYLELYNLALDPRGQTRYSVEYVLRREVPKGRVARLFGRTQTETTATRTTAEGRTPRDHVYLEIDLRDAKDAERLALIVRVTDQVSGATAHRVLSFDVDDDVL